MYYVYLLKLNNTKNQYYTGMTGNIENRIDDHIRGRVTTTKRLGEPNLIYYEAYLEHAQAFERERQLKRFGSAYYALLKRLNEK